MAGAGSFGPSRANATPVPTTTSPSSNARAPWPRDLTRRTGFLVIHRAAAHATASSSISTVRGHCAPKRTDALPLAPAKAVAQPNDGCGEIFEPLISHDPLNSLDNATKPLRAGPSHPP